MIKKVFFNLVCLSFLFSMEAFAAESGGMPQLNPEFWISQIFWLTLSFGILYVVLSNFILPKISTNLEVRKSQILENIESAEKQRKESEKKIKEFEEIIIKSKNDAKSYFNQVREKVIKDIKIKKESLDKQLEEEIKKTETEIQSFRDKAPEKINLIAIEISNNLIQKLIGVDVNNSSISAIVNDFSKRNRDEYYGN